MAKGIPGWAALAGLLAAMPALAAPPKEAEAVAAVTAVQQEAVAFEACVKSGLAVLRGYELRRAGGPEAALADEAALLAKGDPDAQVMLAAPLEAGYAITDSMRIGARAIEVRETCLQETSGTNPLTAAALSLTLAHKATAARLACAGKLDGRAATSSELQYLGCLPSQTPPTLPDSLGGSSMLTELDREGGKFAVTSTANFKGTIGIATCMLLNNTPQLDAGTLVRCRLVEDYAVLKVTHVLQETQQTTEVSDLDALTQQLLQEYLAGATAPRQ